MQIGDLVTWKVDVALLCPMDIAGDKLEYGVVIGFARKVDRKIDLLWVKFLTGHNAKTKKTLCNIEHLVLVKDIDNKSDYF